MAPKGRRAGARFITPAKGFASFAAVMALRNSRGDGISQANRARCRRVISGRL